VLQAIPNDHLYPTSGAGVDGGVRSDAGVAPADAGVAPPGNGTGLTGQYFDNMDLTGATQTRIDPTIDFGWGQGAPITGIGVDTFSVRWTGQLLPKYTETYAFTTTSDDGVRLWVNDVLVVDNWTDHASTSNTGTIALVAGQKVDLKME